MDISVSQEQANGIAVSVFRISGDIDARSQAALETEAQKAREQGATNILLDLSKVRYISSAGLRTIHFIFTLLRRPEEADRAVQQGVREGTYRSPHLKLYNPNKDVLGVLNLAGYDMFLDIHYDYKSALASFKS